jgi:hypothetical protein
MPFSSESPLAIKFIKMNKTIIFLLFCMGVKHGFSLMEEHRLSVFENRVLKGIFGPKRK